MSPVAEPYGCWKSSLSADHLSKTGVRFGHLVVDDRKVFWLEGLPAEGGRTVIRCKSLDALDEPQLTLTAKEFSVRTRAHEYGGADFSVSDNKLVFSNDSDQCLYLQDLSHPSSKPLQITPKANFRHQYRYADMVFSKDNQWIICVRESHDESGDPLKVHNELVKISLASDIADLEVLVSGADFYSHPRISPSGKKLAWTCWQHPNMPWDETQLWQGELDEKGNLSKIDCLINRPNESIVQPNWSPNGVLYFISDRNNWWNIYSIELDKVNKYIEKCIVEKDVEFAIPQWQFGITRYCFITKDKIAAVYVSNGSDQFCIIDLSDESDSNQLSLMNIPFCNVHSSVYVESDLLITIAASETQSSDVIAWNMKHSEKIKLNTQSPQLIDKGDVSTAEAISFDTTLKNKAHAFYYAPKNTEYQPLSNEKPPLIVMSHGGPTASTSPEFNAAIQYWTHRGFAVVDVNYRGSTGYGRKYRDSLKAQWGILDVDDCVHAAKYLACRGDVDAERIAIRGGSAGGYTVYTALINYNYFSAGTSRYGVADLKCLVVESHKFEVRYLDSMIGPWPESIDLYESRSPINNASKIVCPVLLLQGDEDAVVPPEQSISMAKALDENNIPHALVILKGEQHGFRKSENISLALELELEFYCKIFHIEQFQLVEKLALKYSDKV